MEEQFFLYDRIYQIANANMVKGGKQFPFSQTAFCSILYKDPMVIDAEEFMDMEFEDFLVSAYLRCLNVLPDMKPYYKLRDRLCSKYHFDDLSIKCIFLQSICSSAAFKSGYKKITGMEDLYSVIRKNAILKFLFVKTYGFYAAVRATINRYIIIPIWLRMPDKIKNIVRRMLGRKS